jgi:diaminopimelate decarboxylase
VPTTRDPGGRLRAGGVDLLGIALDPRYGTPAYVYDLGGMTSEARALEAAFEGAPHLVAYAVKANSAGPVLRALAAEGCGADVVSGAELELALLCGIHPERIVFSGVAKLDPELDLAISRGQAGIGAIQLESIEEIPRVEARATAVGRIARVSARVNPGVERDMLGTHAHIATGHDEAKFGIPKEDIGLALDELRRTTHVQLVGFTSHVGSQFTSTDAYESAARSLFDIVRSVRAEHGRALTFIDTGGGFGIDYGEGCIPRPADFVSVARAGQRAAGLDDLALYVEPGRSLVGAHGVLLATTVQAKRTRSGESRRWLMIDAGLNDLLRPALYQARHRIVGLLAHGEDLAPWRVVGPVCESADDFGEHVLPSTPPHAVAILDAGAYGYTMASRYNGRPLPAEVFVRDGRVVTARRRAPAMEWVADRNIE